MTSFLTYFKTVSPRALISCGQKYAPCLVSASYLYLLICQDSSVCVGRGLLACSSEYCLELSTTIITFLKLKKSHEYMDGFYQAT